MKERSVQTAYSLLDQTLAECTIVDVLRRRALNEGATRAYTFLPDGEAQEITIDYRELDFRARSIAILLEKLGASEGDRVLLLYPQGIDYVAAFLGCLYAGVVAVPAYPPRRNASLGRIQAILADSGATVALTTTKIVTLVETRMQEEAWLNGLRWHSTDDLDSLSASEWQPPALNENTLAFLQYTSGSTSTPKGVMVNHGNLLLTLQDMDLGWNHTTESVIVTWLPMFHDMGLIYGILQPLYSGIPCVFMPPAAFLQSPIRWLRAISRFRGTHSGAPNFAYELCLNKISAEQRASLDLSSWRMALNAAEPVRPSTLRHFSEVFAPCGFDASAFSPGYGLAECTLKATAVRTSDAPKVVRVRAEALEHDRVELANADVETRELVCCGNSEIGTQIVIVKPGSHKRCSKNEVGEIWLSGPVVTQGYWNRPEDSAATFDAYLADTGEGPFMRTGDTGFLHDGELCITGRLKDLIIIRGVNHYPQDIELTVQQCHPGLAPDCGAVFSVEAGGEARLVVVQELERRSRRRLDEANVIQDIRHAIAEQHELKAYAIVLIKPTTLPKTSSGKIRRSDCRAKFLSGELDVIAEWLDGAEVISSKSTTKPAPEVPEHPKSEIAEEAIQAWLIRNLSCRSNIPAAEIDIQEPFTRYGLDSMGAVELSAELEKWLGRRVDPTVAYDYPSIASLANHLAGERNSHLHVAVEDSESNAIAVIGLGCRFPQAESPDAFWSLLHNGVDAISEVPKSRWNGDGPRWGGFLDHIDKFDSQFFGISPREAEQMDPQQRLLLEVCWEAMEQTGKAPEQLIGTRSGVFVGISSNEYSRIAHDGGLDPYSATGNAGSIAANRISYQFDFRGPSWAVDTACSSSLVAIHQALQSLRRNECDLAFAGGVSLILTPDWTIAFQKAGMLSPDGRCKTFDASADGYVRGEGCGIILLKRLTDALRDGDTIQAVIRGSSVNQDGRSNGLTAPNGPSQREVIRAALKDAAVSPEDITYIEAHGTATSLGDPIELNALKEVLAQRPSLDQRCWIGSVKTNCGHLEAAAGICGVIKVILALKHEEIPPHLHLNSLNPLISLEGTPLAIPTAPQPWRKGMRRRIAGVSSFGFGGTNAHVILEEAPAVNSRPSTMPVNLERTKHLFALSAKSEPALQDLTRRYVERLGGPLREVPVEDVCFSVNTGRSHFKSRLAVIADSTPALADKLHLLAENPKSFSVARERPKSAFLFTGQGSQYAKMGRQLYETQPRFRQTLEACDQILRPFLSQPLLPTLYSDDQALLQRFFADGACVQTALFSLEYALYALWSSWGFKPDAVMGHSLGEYVAACVAGCFSLEDGLRLVAERGRLMQETVTGYKGAPPSHGEMIAVFADPARLAGIIAASQGKVVIAALNNPESVVLSGAQEDMAKAAAACEVDGLTFERLHVGQAFHSPLIEPILDALEDAAKRVNFKPLTIPLVSNLTGDMYPSGESPDAEYWRRHAREAVHFQHGIETLLNAGMEVFIEVGPRPVLTSHGKRCKGGSQAIWLPSLAPGKNDWDVLLGSVAAAYQHGIDIDWNGFDRDYPRNRVSLPTYPFQRKRHWVGSSPETGNAPEAEKKMQDRHTSIQNSLLSLVAGVLHIPAKDVDAHTPFLDMGADSIAFLDAVRRIQQTFGVKIPIRSFFEDLTNIELLAMHIDQHAAANWTSSAQPAQSLPSESAQLQPEITKENRTSGPTTANPTSAIEQIVLRQLDLMNSQLALLRGQPVSENHAAERAVAMAETGSSHTPLSTKAPTSESKFVSEEISERRVLSTGQQRYLDYFAFRYAARTQRSKQAAQSSRRVFADLRSVMALRPEIKEMSYPIIAERSLGSHFWDVDGNEYIDIAMGFGVNLFGHRAPFLEQAIDEQIQRGTHVGPQSDIAAEVAELVSEITGMKRVTFCNSGTEAVMAAIRMVRAASGRSKIVMFSGSYHGHSDATMAVARRQEGQWRAVPMAPGIPQYIAEDVLVLPYGEARSLELIEAHTGELAAVLVEPVQSRSPGLQPVQFLKRLREITQSAGVALIFDEVITGFRIHPRGAQGYFGIHPDLATYGKIVGGGMPIGVVAGKPFYLDRIDGGAWNYGDDSKPEVSRTFVAGTFCKHPLAMACARATLKYLKTQGPQLQEKLNARTARFAAAADSIFNDAGVPVKTQHCGSLFRFALAGNTSYVYQPLEMDLLYHHLIQNGVYVWEGRTCFLSTAHSESDLERILAALKTSVHDMQQGGFWNRTAKSEAIEVRKDNTAPQTLPLTSAQKQLWALAKMDEVGSLAYTLCVALELRGPLQHAALKRAIQTVVNRHDALRTRISEHGDVQEVLPDVSIDCPLIDYSLKSPQERQDSLAEWLKGQSRTPFDLDRAPLFRTNLLRLDDEVHILSIAAHHVVVDGWSMGVILTEICELYAATCAHAKEPEAPQLQFGDIIRWQEQQRESPQMTAQGAYWRMKFEGSSPVLDLPTDHSRPPESTFHGHRETLRLDKDFAQALRQVSRKQDATLFMTLLSAYTLLLHRLSSQEEVIVGIPVAGRELEGSERLVGYCAHVLPVRSRLEGLVNYQEYLAALKTEILTGYENQNYPFAWLIEALEAKGQRSRLVNALFNLDRPVIVDGMPGLEVKWIPHPISSTAFDLNMNVTEVDGGLVLDLDGNTDLWEPASIRRMLTQFHSILQSVCEDVQRPAKEISLLSPVEQKLLISDWNETVAEYPLNTCIHQLFEERVEETPDAIALIFAEGQLTYRALNAAANRLAYRLRSLGAKPEMRVGICVDRRPELIIGLLAILKAGSAYVPLDPSYPQERLSYIIEHAEVEILITEKSLHTGLQARSIVYVDDEETQAAEDTEQNLQSGVLSQNPAYVIYTSGSTGKPKGVIIEHRSAVNFLTAMPRLTDFTSTSSMLAITSVSFDTHVLEIYLPLAFGGRIVLAGAQEARDGKELGRIIRENRVSIIHATPATYRLLIEDDPASLHDVQIISGGDALPGQLGRTLISASKGLQNLYGPTETTVYSSAHDLRDNKTSETGRDGYVALGRPIANTRLYIFDKEAIRAMSMCPVAVGTPGELYIGGDGLARGYLKRPDLTAQRFVPDPFNPKPGSRVYSSGDLVCHRPNGVIDFLGRLDFQVKVSGHRIEIGEVEAVLATHDGVKQCVVAARKREDGQYRLVGYVVSVATPPTVAELRSFLAKTLPAYMIPEAFVMLDTLPMTPNRKVDRTALPPPVESLDAMTHEYTAPRTETESKVASIYCEVLDRQRVSVHDGFFELGGQSLLAIKVRSRVLDAFGIELPARRVFDMPTVALLSEHIDQVRQDNTGWLVPPIVPVIQDCSRPLSFAQQRLWFLEQHQGSSAAFNMAGALCLEGPLDLDSLQASLDGIVDRHEVLRTTFAVTEAGPVQLIVPPKKLALNRVDLSGQTIEEQSSELKRITTAEATRTFDLEHGPLMRVTLIRCRKQAVGGSQGARHGIKEGEAEFHLLLLTLHHIVFDGWSIDIFFRELSELYRAHIEGGSASMPKLPVQYSDFAFWQRRWLVPGNAVFESHLTYWREQLKSLPVFEVPSDRPRPEKPTLRGARHTFTLDTSTVQQLRALCTSESCTLFVGLLTAFNVLLQQLSGQNDIVVGTDVANRTRTGIENLIGFFVNQLVLRTGLCGDPSFRTLLARTHEVVLAAEEHQELPFDRLVEALRPERSTNRAPLFQIKIVFADAPPPSLSMPGIEASLIEVETGTTQLDLILFLVDAPEGLRGTFEYNTDLFDESTIVRITREYLDLIHGAISTPDLAISSMKTRTSMETTAQTITRRKRTSMDLQKLKGIRVEPKHQNDTEGFRVTQSFSSSKLPVVLQPANGNADLASVAEAHRGFVGSKLIEHGAILFRGFDTGSVSAFDKFTRSICSDLFVENGEHPRENITGSVYTPVFFSPERKLLWHNENTFNYRWPQKIWFCCVQPAEHGGETPIVDSRKVFACMDPAIRERFMRHGVMYVRNYGDGPGLSWQQVFRTTDRAEVEKYCRENLIEFEWKDRDRLRTRSTRPAAIPHPVTGEYCWINQAQHWHLSCLDDQTREALLSVFAEEDLPRTCYYGDGSQIADEDMRSICQLYNQLEVSFPWQSGDVLMVDNISTAHARNAFSGDRKLLVAMGELRSYADFSN